MTSWSSLAPSTSIRPSFSSHCFCARSRSDSTVSPAAISSSRFRLAWATLMSEVAILMVTTRSGPGSKRK